jgi:hypothetical protein
LSWGALSKLLAVRVGGMPKGALPPFLCADFDSAVFCRRFCLSKKHAGFYGFVAVAFQRGVSIATIASPIKQKVTERRSRFERNVIPNSIAIAIMPPCLGLSNQRHAQAVSESTITLE